MVEYNIEMQIAGLCLSLVILFSYIISKKSNSVQYKIFPWHLGVNICLLIFDIASCILIPHMDRFPVLNVVVGKIYIIFIAIWISLTTIYSLTCSINENSSMARLRWFYAYGAVVLILLLGCIGFMAFGRLNFFCQGRRVYSYGPVAVCAYAYTAINLLGTIVFLIVNNNSITTNAKIPVWAYVSFEILGALIQFIVPDLLVVSFFSSLCEFTVFRSLENSRTEEEQNEIIKSFAEVIEGRDPSTGEHVKRTTTYVKIIIDNLSHQKKYRKFFTKEYADTLTYAAAMHDVGKIAIPDSVLQKPGILDSDERKIIETHTVKGAEIIRNSFHKIGTSLFNSIAHDLSLSHHERWDGSGYPYGVKGDDIPLAAQIMAVADVFDAVSQERCYRPPMSLDKSFEVIESGSGTHFSPAIVKAFLDSRDEVSKAYHGFIQEEEQNNRKRLH